MQENQVRQVQLGQVHTAEGQLDFNMMYLMHHGFRRDLRDFAAAVPATPVRDAEVWRALDRRWRGMATSLHHHHRAEDTSLWPPLLQRVDAAGDAAGRDALEAMEAEHALIDPLITAGTNGFRAMVTAPDATMRDRLALDLQRTRDVLLNHLAHEETAAVPLAQQHLSHAAMKALDRAARKEYGIADLVFTVPWTALEVPADQLDLAVADGGWMIRAILAVTRRSFERRHRIAFRYLPAAQAA